MLNNIISFSIKNKLIVGLFTLALIVFGGYQATKLPIDAVPDITDNQVIVITTSPALGATDIERIITFPIEQEVSNILGINELRSFSRFGLSLVTIVFDDAIDIYWARQQVAERLIKVQTQIPAGLGVPELGPISTGLGEIYQYMVKPKKGYENQYDATELRTIQDWIVRRQLLGVKGIAEVSSFGGNLKQYELAIDPNKLNALGVTIADVFSSVAANNQNAGGSYIEKGPTVLFIRTEGLMGSIADIEQVVVKNSVSGKSILVKDIAKVQIGKATRFGAMCYNDQGEVAGAIVMMLKGANSSEVIKNVKERIAQIQKTLPKGVEIEPFLDRTKMVNNAIGTVETNLLEGALIVVFVLVIFLGNIRAGLLVASVIPLSLLFAICMMNFFGVSGNLMSLGALDFGLIVDGAVIIVEAVIHGLAIHKITSSSPANRQISVNNLVENTSKQMMNSAVFGQIIILIVYMPIFFLQGIEGKMFIPMAQTVAFTLLGAFILSLTYIPMMSSLILGTNRKQTHYFSDKAMHKLEVIYEKNLLRALRFPKIILLATLLVFSISLLVMSRLGGEFIPELEEGDFAVDTRVLTGSSIQTTIDYTQKAAHILLSKFPEIEKIVTKIGSGEVPTDPMPMEASDLMVILKDKSEWKSAKTFNELSDKMSVALKELPGITAGFQYPVQMRFNELMTGARQDVVCKIFGENLDSLAILAKKLGKTIATVEGTENLYIEPITGIPQIVINYNRPLIAQYKASIDDINTIVNAAFAGQKAGTIYEEEKRFDLVIRLDETQRKNLVDVQNLLISLPNGQQIPLSQLAEVSIANGPNQIQREDAKRRITVGFNVSGRDVQSIVDEIKSKVGKDILFPAGYFVNYGGSFENLQRAKNRLMIVVPIALLSIFLLLYFAFGSIKESLLIYTAIPLSAMGGIFLLAAREMPFSISAAVGFIALFGVAVLNGIVLLSEFKRLKMNGLTDLKEVVITGTKHRLRPVLMTAFVASLGFLPMALSNGSGAEVQRPLATVVIGGLLIATFLTLFVLPILYLMMEKSRMVKPKISILIIVGSMSFVSFGQTPIDPQKSVEIAIKNSKLLTVNKLRLDQNQANIQGAKMIPKAIITSELGQINSSYFDNKINLSQSFLLPKINKSHSLIFQETSKNIVLEGRLTETELSHAVLKTFYQILFLKESEKLLLETDSLWTLLSEKVNLKLLNGEMNLVEKNNIDLQKLYSNLQLNQFRSEQVIYQQKFNYLLNVEESFNPIGPIKAILTYDPTLIAQHPTLQLASQQKEIALAKTQLEKAKLGPELNFGLSSGSIRGVGADNVFYSASKRFNLVQLGMNIPLFTKSQKATIAASKMEENITEKKTEILKQNLIFKANTAFSQYQKAEKLVNDYENYLIPLSEKTTVLTKNKFDKGEIEIMDFIYQIKQLIALKSSYLD
ncbi:MAG: CusA/CzcA family heavy metal efflux RND transporter, partial [Bacteroidota bacterium]